MALSLRRNKKPKKTKFQAAADGSMSLMDHLRDLRSRLFKACLGLVAGVLVGMYFADIIQEFINAPYCDWDKQNWLDKGHSAASYDGCNFNVVGPLDNFLLRLKIGLFAGIILSAPIWLYHLWAFIAPGLHKHERKYTYYFAAMAGPLFFAGATLGWFVISKSLQFFLALSNQYKLTVDLTGYFDFVTNVMLLFGAGFEFPLVVVLLNVIGIASAKRLLGWWRIATFLVFLFCAIVTPTPDPFGMIALAIPMVMLYFAAVGFAFINDRRRNRKTADWDTLDPDEASVIDDGPSDIGEVESVDDSDDLVDEIAESDGGSDNRPVRRYDEDAT
ncbi:twin-arginine translocase subunit TatC [Stackebrandtia nassauensis]|uniref:Sec-independent protein translocase protein TatC n=1 Tax=Stackebrandtia nassauensis (strain DSM 44728 / CIP 108903 / NRRL B-16338 / NBRC 102104 / LLR-40K-21) TaxID=446470 RepID=D3Q548_STANL|nr:twin-arginine translocase subunit TatC [Stackebrandtia nassauensis]ADD44097.1 Sec-independent protein translocase, TatC subunit [Stackebrandtia nassauensis DSM 44728]